VERGLRQRGGGVLPRDPAARAAGRRRLPAPGEDLRHRRGRRGAGHGSRGRYPPAALELLGPQRLATYFVEQDGGYLFRPELRQNIIFGRHDLLADAPISRVSLLLCRNVLMYFTAETQARILERFAFALQDRGLLVLGRAEMLLTYNELFAPVDLPNRVFRTAGRPPGPRTFGFGPAALARQAVSRKVTVAAFLGAPEAQLVLDAETRVVLVNDTAQRQLGRAGRGRRPAVRRAAAVPPAGRPAGRRGGGPGHR
jgi:hypothetical protein